MKSIELVTTESTEGAVRIRFLDQTKLPNEETYIETDDPGDIVDGIKRLSIRGAPLIGIAAAYAVAVSASKAARGTPDAFLPTLTRTFSLLSSSRPTAVNLFWALKKMEKVLDRHRKNSPAQIAAALMHEAIMIHRHDQEMCEQIGRHGAALIPRNARVLTHCNTGALATGGEGTAQRIITMAAEQGKIEAVFVAETRPLLQGARLTMWELMRRNIPAVLITDSSAAFLMQQGKIDLVVVGADRIAANGGVANKIGTYNLAVIAAHHRVPLYVAAPSSSIDFSLSSEKQIFLEERDAREVTHVLGREAAPAGASAYAVAFDVTPPDLVTAIITEEGVLRAPFNQSLAELRMRLAREGVTV